MIYAEAALLQQSLRSCISIAKSDFVNAQPSWVTEAAFVSLMIGLKDCVALLAKHGRKISFTDDLPSGVDITKQIIDVRNAACHLGSASRIVGKNGNSLNFGVLIGSGVLASIDDTLLESPYDDDVAFFYGTLRILLKRHIYRAIDEALPRSEQLSKQNGHHWWPIS